jgi:hypothetical protein
VVDKHKVDKQHLRQVVDKHKVDKQHLRQVVVVVILARMFL